MTRHVRLLAALILAAGLSAPEARHAADGKLDVSLRARAHAPRGSSRVIVRTAAPDLAVSRIRDAGGTFGRCLRAADSVSAEVPDRALDALAARPEILGISLDRPVTGTADAVAATVGARWVQESLGVDGSGIGVATIDSGVSAAHDDLAPQRIAHFADFVNALPSPYDDYGHGTHVAGIIAGNGYDSGGAKKGLAPGATLVVLKALDATGSGYISNVISAVDYAIANRAAYNIRVINLSVAAGVYESYTTDPLTLAARRAVDAGIVVVAAAGNFGLTPQGNAQYSGITAPGNAPWVLTVGASNDMGTPDRSDDVVAPFSSRGPSAVDGADKPDLVAPGVNLESTTDPGSALYATHPNARIWGSVRTASPPYLSLSGTSMAAPVVTGTVALMLQANPALSPGEVKAILRSTAQRSDKFDAATQGAGFLDARAAVELARRIAGDPGVKPDGETPIELATCSDDPSNCGSAVSSAAGSGLAEGTDQHVGSALLEDSGDHLAVPADSRRSGWR
jgi:serine protease AprX